ncbi:MAG: DUF2849 domain-containing protein [Devosiaceae bacterium]|nr:DUF2849 domain-containing protein [Devosiaceae bacterium]
MARAFVTKIVTANDLLVGDAVYLTSSNLWSRDFHEAKICLNEDEATRLLDSTNFHQHHIVGAYLADVAARDGRPVELLHFREKFRTKGPSNYFHGKQEFNNQQGVA